MSTPTDDRTIREAERQMLMVRPWHVAEDSSIWEITGDYRGGHGAFTSCLAMALPHRVTGGDVLFKMLGEIGRGYEIVSPEQITQAVPLLLVHRSDPGEAYHVDDQAWIDGAR